LAIFLSKIAFSALLYKSAHTLYNFLYQFTAVFNGAHTASTSGATTIAGE